MKGFFKFGNPVIELNIDGRKIEVLLDSGFNGSLMLPHGIIYELGLEQIGISDYINASGKENLTKVYLGKIKIFDNETEITILSTDADFSLAGMDLFHSCRIILEIDKDIVEIIESK